MAMELSTVKSAVERRQKSAQLAKVKGLTRKENPAMSAMAKEEPIAKRVTASAIRIVKPATEAEKSKSQRKKRKKTHPKQLNSR
jgi:hypothetical protein